MGLNIIWNQTTLWFSATTWTDGTNQYGAMDLVAWDQGQVDLGQYVKNYIKQNNYTTGYWISRPSQSGWPPYIDIVVIDLDQNTLNFALAVQNNPNLQAALQEATDLPTVETIAAQYGFTLDQDTLATLDSITPSLVAQDASERMLKIAGPGAPSQFNKKVALGSILFGYLAFAIAIW